MLNEDELRDALLLVFANKQDLPVGTEYLCSRSRLLILSSTECHECRRGH